MVNLDAMTVLHSVGRKGTLVPGDEFNYSTIFGIAMVCARQTVEDYPLKFAVHTWIITFKVLNHSMISRN